MYADDIVLLYSAHSDNDIMQMANTDLLNLSIWMEKNKLTINVQKTKYLGFGTLSDLTLLYRNVMIKKVDSFKYLGVYFDEKMKFDIHIQKNHQPAIIYQRFIQKD